MAAARSTGESYRGTFRPLDVPGEGRWLGVPRLFVDRALVLLRVRPTVRCALWRHLALGLSLGLCLVLVACGDQTLESRPPSKAGALPSLKSGEKPDVLVVLSPALDRESLRLGKANAPGTQIAQWCARGITLEAAYVRFETAEGNRADLLGLGLVGNDDEWPRKWSEGGYRFGAGQASEREAFFGQGSAQADAQRATSGPGTSGGPGIYLQWVANPGWEALEAELVEIAQAAPPVRPRILVFCALQGASPEPTLSEGRLGIPLVVVLPDGLNGGEVRPQVVALPDVGVTLLDLCGLWPEGTPEDRLGAASFARILLQEPVVWRGFVFAKGQGKDAWLRSARWRLARTQSGEVLSLVEKDPNRVADDRAVPGAAAQLKIMGEHLDEWSVREMDPKRR